MKKLNFQKKTVLLLVVVAIILAVLSISLRVVDSAEKVSTQSRENNIDLDGGEVGVTILPPEGIEDLGDEVIFDEA